MLEAHKAHSLESLAFRHLGRTALTYEDVCGKGANQIPFAQVELERATDYSCEDADMALHVHQALLAAASRPSPASLDVYRRIEMPASEVLGRIERVGVLIDSALLDGAEPGARRAHGRARAARPIELAGQPFNLGSPKQIGEILFGKLGLPVERRPRAARRRPTRTCCRSSPPTTRCRRKLLEHREPVEAEGHLHRQAAADGQPGDRPRAHQLRAGGRGDRAALEQRPEPAEHPDPHRRGPAHPRGLRRARRARSILSADYSQIELRIMAHISGDAGLLHAFGDGIDVHRATAAEVFAAAARRGHAASSGATPR